MSKLHDPDLPPGAIVKEFDDGGALRNDGVRLKPANQNPWYVLATLHGEQPADADLLDYDTDLADRNREAWNRWAQDELDDAEKAELLHRYRARLNDKTASLPDPSEECDFSKTYFSGFTCFVGYIFNNTAYYRVATFRKDASFTGAIFSQGAWFMGLTFCGSASFVNVVFGKGGGFFRAVTFSSYTDFDGATFGFNADFDAATFSQSARFIDTTFSLFASFNSATFKGPTRFERARFLTNVPEFYATELYEDTVFPIPDNPTANWPPQSGAGVMPADEQKRAYSRLRLFFAKTQQIDEEQFFHRQEMRCKRAMAGRATKGMYSIYSALSDYGISIWRPLAYLTLLTVLGGDLLGAHRQALGEGQDWAMLGENMGWSLGNLVPFTGFGRTFFGPDFYQSLPGWLQAFAGAQTLAAIPLLFLLGLGLRNTFRLR